MSKSNTHRLSITFSASVLLAGLFFAFDIYVSNRANSYAQSISSIIAYGFLSLIPFIYGCIKSREQKNYNWYVLNILSIIIIIGWTLLVSLVLYSFKDFQLTVSP